MKSSIFFLEDLEAALKVAWNESINGFYVLGSQKNGRHTRVHKGQFVRLHVGEKKCDEFELTRLSTPAGQETDI